MAKARQSILVSRLEMFGSLDTVFYLLGTASGGASLDSRIGRFDSIFPRFIGKRLARPTISCSDF